MAVCQWRCTPDQRLVRRSFYCAIALLQQDYGPAEQNWRTGTGQIEKIYYKNLYGSFNLQNANFYGNLNIFYKVD